jgi:DNA-binding beta-propeller fold protein YncE
VPVGAGALNVAFDPVSGLAYVANRGAGTVTAVDGNGRIVANLEGGSFPNYTLADGRGNVYLINKAKGQNDPTGDRISQILRK